MDLLVRHHKMPAPTLLPEKLMWGRVVPECTSPLLHRCDSSAVFSLYTEDLILNCKSVSNTVNSKKQSVSVCEMLGMEEVWSTLVVYRSLSSCVRT